MKSFLIACCLLLIRTSVWSNQNKGYVSSKEGVTIFAEGDWDSVAMQKILDADLDFIVGHIHKPLDLNVFIVLGAYGIHTSYRKNKSGIFISVAYDSFDNRDTLYDESPERDGLIMFGSRYANQPGRNWVLNDSYSGDFSIVSPHIAGQHGLKIYYQNIRDTIDYYNHLLSVVDFAIKHIDEVKKEQRRICLPANLKDWEISILTYDTGKLRAIPVVDWGFSVDPKKRGSQTNHRVLIYAASGIAIFAFLFAFFRWRMRTRSVTRFTKRPR